LNKTFVVSTVVLPGLPYLQCPTWGVTSKLLACTTAESTVVFEVAVVRLEGRLTLRHSIFTWALTCTPQRYDTTRYNATTTHAASYTPNIYTKFMNDHAYCQKPDTDSLLKQDSPTLWSTVYKYASTRMLLYGKTFCWDSMAQTFNV